MADPSKTKPSEADAELAALNDAVTPAPPAEPATDRDKKSKEAHDAELARQKDVADAVDAANADELPKLGGPMLNPGGGQ